VPASAARNNGTRSGPKHPLDEEPDHLLRRPVLPYETATRAFSVYRDRAVAELQDLPTPEDRHAVVEHLLSRLSDTPLDSIGFVLTPVARIGADVFVDARAHQSEGQTLEENQQVEFEIAQGPKGAQAVSVRPLA